ncbi:MAG: hypothetical protein IPM96_20580 [Ignavibacteria bacterium]|nr:hypothetical protein [Ignavibacteria bacterium]
MNFQPSASGYPFTFTWNNSLFPADGSFYLKDITGVIVNVNMRNQNSYVLTNSAIGSLNIVYTYNTTKNISVLSGWNIISVPLNVPDMSVAGIFPGAASPAYSYNNGYINSTTLTNGKGYWLKFNSAGNYTVTGLPVNPENINVSNLWNLIGPFDKDIPVSNIISVPSGLISSYFFGFNDGYIISDTLKAGRGYWIRSNGSGYLKKGSADNIALKENTGYENMISFSFYDASGKSAQLYLSNGTGNIQNADLPPVPPAGIFDVRYSSDKFIESSGQNQIVKLNSSGESF